MQALRWFQHYIQSRSRAKAAPSATIAAQLYRLTTALLLAVGLFWILFLLIEPAFIDRFDSSIPLTAVLVSVLLLLRFQQVYAACLTLVVGIWSGLILVCIVNGGVQSSAYAGLILATLSAGLLLGRRAALICAGASILAGLLLMYANQTGLLPTPLPLEPVAIWISQSIFFVSAAIFLQLATGSINDALQQAKLQLIERQEIERQLRDQEQQLHNRDRDYRLAITAADAVPYYRDYATDSYMFMGDAIATITGFPLEKITPEFLNSIEVEASMRGNAANLPVPPAIKLARAGKLQEWRCDTLIRTHSGELRWLADSAIQVSNDQGDIVGSFGILQDITERKRSEQALQESEERFRRLAEAGFEGIGMIEGDRLIDANPRLAEMLGYSMESLLGRSVMDFIPTEEHDLVLQHIQAGGPTPIAHQVRHSDGSLFPVETQARHLPRGGRSASVIAMRNMSERLRLEEHLRQAQKLQAVGQLAGGLAHDFNNLLTIIISYTDVLIDQAQSERLPDWLRQDLEQIRHAGQRAATLTRQLLAFSRRQVLHVEVLNLNTVLSGIMPMLQRLSGPGFEIQPVLDPALGWVCADAGQLEQVIINLVVNGRDAMPYGGALVIETKNLTLNTTFMLRHAELEPGQYVLLSVRDSGIGMDAETQAHVFEPFFTTKERGHGTGLGLATAHGIIKQSGGHIWFSSEPDKGTTFTIGLPRASAPEQPAPSHRAAAVVSTGTETILLVEDDLTVRQLVRTILQRYGYHVLESDNEEAEQVCASYPERIDLLLTDVMMPGIDGVELARRLLIQRPELRVLYMSGYTDGVVTDHSLVEGNAAFLQKPFAPTALAAKVRSVLDSQ